jgi:hypothetical protein
MANLLLLTTCLLLIQSKGKSKISSHNAFFSIPTHAGAISQSIPVIGTPTTTDYDSILMPDIPYTASLDGSADRFTSGVATTSQPQPTPTSTTNFISPDAVGSGGSGLMVPDLYQTSESSTFASSPTIPPSPTNTYTVPEPVPTPDVIIRLRLNFSIGITDQDRMQTGRNLSLFIQDILQLTTPPVVSQEPGNIFNVLLVSSSSMDAGVASGNISAVTSLLTGVHTSELLRVNVSLSVQIMSRS